MAAISKSGTPSPSTVNIPAANKITGLLAGEDIAAGDACYIKSDGKVWKSTGTSASPAAEVDGFAPVAAKTGEAVTLLFGVTWRYGAGLTPGKRVYLAATAGTLADAASTGGVASIGFVVDATRVYLDRSRYPEPSGG